MDTSIVSPWRRTAAAALILFAAGGSRAASYGPVDLATEAHVDSVTVGQRFHVAYRFAFPDSLTPVVPEKLDAGTCRVVSLQWSEHRDHGRVERTADVIFIPVQLDSVVVPSNSFAFVSPRGDTVVASSDAVEMPLRRIAAHAKDTRPLKQQWTPSPNYLLWIALGLGAVALAAAVVWWVRRRRARRLETAVPEVRLPPDIVALTELERIAAMGLVERGEFKTYYTLVVDVVRRYLESRFGIEAMDRTSPELLLEVERHSRIEGLGDLLDEADLVKFAKLVPTRESAAQAIEQARSIVVATTPRAPAPAEAGQPAVSSGDAGGGDGRAAGAGTEA